MAFRLIVITPFGQYFDSDIDMLSLTTEAGRIGIMSGHRELVSIVTISPLTIHVGDSHSVYACSGGVLRVEKEKTILLLNAVEAKKDIDVSRAILAKEKAEQEIDTSTDANIINKAKIKLQKALNRIKVANGDY